MFFYFMKKAYHFHKNMSIDYHIFRHIDKRNAYPIFIICVFFVYYDDFYTLFHFFINMSILCYNFIAFFAFFCYNHINLLSSSV